MRRSQTYGMLLLVLLVGIEGTRLIITDPVIRRMLGGLLASVVTLAVLYLSRRSPRRRK